MGSGERRSRREFLCVAGATVAGGAGCLSGGASVAPGPDDAYDIGMTSIAFVPESLTVPVDTTVVWKNTNSRTHTITAYDAGIPDSAQYFASGGFDSQSAAVDAYYNQLAGGITTNETYRYTFRIPGEYQYFCVPHEEAGMIGEITVTA